MLALVVLSSYTFVSSEDIFLIAAFHPIDCLSKKFLLIIPDSLAGCGVFIPDGLICAALIEQSDKQSPAGSAIELVGGK